MTKEQLQAIGAALRKARQEQLVTLRAYAEACGIGCALLSKMEKGFVDQPMNADFVTTKECVDRMCGE